MKKKFKICIGAAMATIMSVSVCASIHGNAEDLDVIKFSGEITAVTPYGGETVSVVHYGMESVLNMTTDSTTPLPTYSGQPEPVWQ